MARTRSSQRCRGRALAGKDFCFFHDPSITEETRRANARKAAQARRAKPRLPKGYPRRLTTPEAARAALERLYLETRADLVTPQQAQALLEILNRMIHGTRGRSRRRVEAPVRPAASEHLPEPRLDDEFADGGEDRLSLTDQFKLVGHEDH
jgi:hypothetical protein